MSFDLVAIAESKRAYRSRLAALPIAEKLRLLDALGARALAIRKITPSQMAASAREAPEPYGDNEAPGKP